MKTELLESCIESLKLARMQLSDRVEPSITAELDSVITRLELCRKHESVDVCIDLSLLVDTLDVLGKLFGSIETVTHLLDKFLR